MSWELHEIEPDVFLSRAEHFEAAYKLLSEYSACVSQKNGRTYLYKREVPYGTAREFCKWVQHNAGFTTPNLEFLVKKYKECMPSHNQTIHRQDCRLYKAIAHVFEGRVDLSDKQKNELIHLCYSAAKAEQKVSVDCAVSEALSARHEHVPFHQQSLGRRCP